MKSKLISDLQDNSDGPFNGDGAGFLTHISPAADGSSGKPFTSLHLPSPIPTLPAEAVQAQSAVSQSSSGGVGSVVANAGNLVV